MQAKDLHELTKIDQKISSLHEKLNSLYGKRASLLTGNNKTTKRTKKPSLKDIDLSTINLDLI